MVQFADLCTVCRVLLGCHCVVVLYYVYTDRVDQRSSVVVQCVVDGDSPGAWSMAAVLPEALLPREETHLNTRHSSYSLHSSIVQSGTATTTTTITVIITITTLRQCLVVVVSRNNLINRLSAIPFCTKQCLLPRARSLADPTFAILNRSVVEAVVASHSIEGER